MTRTKSPNHLFPALFGTLVCACAATLPAQDLVPALLPLETGTFARETGTLDLDLPIDLPPAQAPEKKKGVWKTSLNLGATLATGNTERRTANLAADAKREVAMDRTTVKVSWNYADERSAPAGSPPGTARVWSVDQRRTAGEAKHDHFLTESKRWYGFLAGDAEYNYNQGVDLRYSVTLGLGHQLIKRDGLEWGLELGVGYFGENPRLAGAPDTDFVTGRAGSELDWQISESWQLLHSLKYFFSLEDPDEMYAISDAKLRANLSKNMFAQLQWILQWDNTPTLQPGGTRSDRVDNLYLLSVGWAF